MTTPSPLLSLIGGRVVGYRRALVEPTGGILEALFLSQACYWQSSLGASAWWSKSREEWQEETGLTRSNQQTCRKNLKARGLLEEKRAGMPLRMLYRVNLPGIRKALNFLSAETAPGAMSTRCAANQHVGRDPALHLCETKEEEERRIREEEGKSPTDSGSLFQEQEGTEEEAKTPQPPAPPAGRSEFDRAGRAEFDAGWAEHRDAGPPRLGPKGIGSPRKGAWKQWGRLLKVSGWSPLQALQRWREYRRLKPIDYWHEVHRLLNPDKEHLTDDSLGSLQRSSTRLRPDRFEAPAPPRPTKGAAQLEHERVIRDARALQAKQGGTA